MDVTIKGSKREPVVTEYLSFLVLIVFKQIMSDQIM